MVRTLSAEAGVPVLCNIHDVQLAIDFSTRIVGLQDGLKIFEGPPNTLDRKALDEIYAFEIL